MKCLFSDSNIIWELFPNNGWKTTNQSIHVESEKEGGKIPDLFQFRML